jgi:hypothetical protein
MTATAQDPETTYGQATVAIDGKSVPGTPRKDPLTDTQVALHGAAHPGLLQYFLDTSKFTSTTSALGTAKQQGRDTNVRSRSGTTTKGEKFWIYGANLVIDAPDTALNANNGAKFYDEVGRMLGIGSFAWTFAAGNQSFMSRPLRDLPVRCIRKPVAFAIAALAADAILFDINGVGMYDLRIASRPYALSPQEEMEIDFTFLSANALLSPTFDIAYQLQLQGIRVFGQKQ